MENEVQLYELNDDQRRIYTDTAQLHEAYMDVFLKSRAYRGGMHWKKAKGKAYLFRSLDRYGYGKSLGPRSEETQSIYAEFHKNKKKLQSRLNHLKDRIKDQARFCKAARITRVPRVVVSILKLLEEHQLLGRNLQIIGTNALYAYEAHAGVFLERGLLATRDMDVLSDIRPRLQMYAVDEIDIDGLIDLLRKADRSFDLLGKCSFRAVNKAGYMVDLVKPEPSFVMKKEKRQLGNSHDLVAAEIRNLDWLVSAPKFSQIVIGENGYPATMVTPDPRAFAVHKLWLSKQVDREPVKKGRDRSQAAAVCRLITNYMPGYKFDDKELRMFPKEIVSEASEMLNQLI